MKDIKKVFRSLEQNLRQSNWFDDGWDIFNRGVYLHLYKDSWYNQNQGGVHFETYIEGPQIQKKEFPILICMQKRTAHNSSGLFKNFLG